MFDNDVRGMQLIAELKLLKTSRDRDLEFSFRADGSVRVTGLRMIRGRTLSDMAQRWGKSATTLLHRQQTWVTIDFRDDVGWKSAEPVDASPDTATIAAALQKCVTGKSISVMHPPRSGATHNIRLVTDEAATFGSVGLRSLLATPLVVDVLIFANKLDVMVARSSNLIGGLAHIGSTRGFAPVTVKSDNLHVGKSSARVARGNWLRYMVRLPCWAIGAKRRSGRASARRRDSFPN